MQSNFVATVQRPLGPREVEDLVGRLTRRYPDVTAEVVAGLVHDALDRTDDATVHAFRLVLAEREVRHELARSTTAYTQRPRVPSRRLHSDRRALHAKGISPAPQTVRTG